VTMSAAFHATAMLTLCNWLLSVVVSALGDLWSMMLLFVTLVAAAV